MVSSLSCRYYSVLKLGKIFEYSFSFLLASLIHPMTFMSDGRGDVLVGWVFFFQIYINLNHVTKIFVTCKTRFCRRVYYSVLQEVGNHQKMQQQSVLEVP